MADQVTVTGLFWSLLWQGEVRAGGASKIIEFARSAPQTVQSSSLFNILNHLALNFSICLWKLQTCVRHDNLAQGCCLYLSKMQSVVPFFFARVKLSSLQSHLWTCPFLKQIRAAHVWHDWSSSHFSPHSEDWSCRLLLEWNLYN